MRARLVVVVVVVIWACSVTSATAGVAFATALPEGGLQQNDGVQRRDIIKIGVIGVLLTGGTALVKRQVYSAMTWTTF